MSPQWNRDPCSPPWGWLTCPSPASFPSEGGQPLSRTDLASPLEKLLWGLTPPHRGAGPASDTQI